MAVCFEFIEIGLLGEDGTAHAFRLSKEIVVPLGIRIGAKVGGFAALPDHTDVDFLAGSFVDGEESFQLGINPLDGVFTGEAPLLVSVPDMGDVLVLAVSVGLGDAGDLIFFHFFGG